MDKLKEFYTSFSFIISFMFISVLISALLGEKFLNKFFLLILASQLLLNVDTAKELINKFSLKENNSNTNNNKNNTDKKNINPSTGIGDIQNGKIFV